MSNTRALSAATLSLIFALLACNFGPPSTPPPTEQPPTAPAATGTPEPTPAPPPQIAIMQEGQVLFSDLSGNIIDTFTIGPADWPKPNSAQVVGDGVYYIKTSAGNTISNVVSHVDATGEAELSFTAAETVTGFAVSSDESRIAWATMSPGTAGTYNCELRTANLDGSDAQTIVQCDPNNGIEPYYTLEPVQWNDDGTLIYSWQITGIGGYILYFGFSTYFRYDPATPASSALIDFPSTTGAPRWGAISPDLARAFGGGSEVVERDLATGIDAILPAVSDQGQSGGASYSADGVRLAYGVARGNMDDEYGQVVVRLDPASQPQSVLPTSGGYFNTTLWVDDTHLSVEKVDMLAGGATVGLLDLQGTFTQLAPGHLIGLRWP